MKPDPKTMVGQGKRLVKRLLRLEPNVGVQVSCQMECLGTEYGQWCFHPAALHQDSVVYSFGVGDDISFDLSLIDEFAVVVHAFDPTPRSIKWVKSQQLPDKFKFFDYGLADFDGLALFAPPVNPDHISHTMLEREYSLTPAVELPVRRLGTIMTTLGHTHIDLLKMDVEGAEYAIIHEIVQSGIDVRQLLVEFHHRFRGVTVARTEEAISSLNEIGLRVSYISPSGGEFSFILDGVIGV